MIKINLLPEENRRRKMSINLSEIMGKYKKFFVPIVSVIGALVFVFFIIIIFYPGLQKKKLNKIKTKWELIKKDYSEVENIKKEMEKLNVVLNNVHKVGRDRILWSARLNDISDSLPPEIQLTELLTGAEKLKDKSERTLLIISGITPSYPGERAISEFVKALRENKNFIKDFPQIEPPSTQTLPDGFKKFILKCYTPAVLKEPVSDKTKKEKKGKK